jgi:hypothetical protein
MTALKFDVDEAHAAIDKARGIVEMVSEACMHKFEYDDATRFTGALWAVTDQLDKLAVMTGLDKPRGEA